MLQENEMRESFNRVIGDFVGLTESAAKVEALSNQVQELGNQVGMLRTENDNLKRDIQEAWDYARKMEAKVTELDNSVHDATEHAKALQETIVASDNRVHELSYEVGQTKANLDNVTHERDEARSSVKDYEVLTADLRQQLEDMTNERNGLQAIADERLKAITDLNSTLGRVKAFLNPEPESVVEFPQYNVG
jgi:chromosome segregation ATPase